MAAPDTYIGREILQGQFRILQKIGTGGMGSVYKALQPEMNRMVAVKILHPKLAGRKDLVSRFRREARAMSHLTHPNTVRVFLYGELEDGSLYIIMEYLEGKNLHQIVKADGPMPVDRALYILIQACGALEEAHRAGIIHRDLKPENIFVSQQGGIRDYAKVLDFGLAKVTEREMRPGSVILTQEGMVFGTPEFMSPEQAQGKPLTLASDLYSLAVILYEVLTGKLPFEAKTTLEYIQLHVNSNPIPIHLRAPGVPFPPLLWPMLERALAKRPEDRFVSASHLAAAMQAVLTNQRELPPAPPPSAMPPAPAAMPSTAPLPMAVAPPQPMMQQMPQVPPAPLPPRIPSQAAPPRASTPTGLIVAIAAACLVVGMLIAIAAMQVLGR